LVAFGDEVGRAELFFVSLGFAPAVVVAESFLELLFVGFVGALAITVSAPAAGAKLVSSPESQRTRSRLPFTAVTTPARAVAFEVTATRSPTSATGASRDRWCEYRPRFPAAQDTATTPATRQICLIGLVVGQDLGVARGNRPDFCGVQPRVRVLAVMLSVGCLVVACSIENAENASTPSRTEGAVDHTTSTTPNMRHVVRDDTPALLAGPLHV